MRHTCRTKRDVSLLVQSLAIADPFQKIPTHNDVHQSFVVVVRRHFCARLVLRDPKAGLGEHGMFQQGMFQQAYRAV